MAPSKSAISLAATLALILATLQLAPMLNAATQQNQLPPQWQAALPPGWPIPSFCSSSDWPIVAEVNGTKYVGCSIYSPADRAKKAQLQDQVVNNLISSGLSPDPVNSVSYDPKSGTFYVYLIRQISSDEMQGIQSRIPGPFTTAIVTIRQAAVCDNFTNPPTGSCNQVNIYTGTMGFRAKQWYCPSTCYWRYGGTTFAHNSVQVGYTVYQPDTSRAYGVVAAKQCANGVDASFFVKNSDQQDMDNRIYTYGSITGDWTSGFVAGTKVVEIGRYSQSLGYYHLDINQPDANTCGTTGTSWKALFDSGAQSGQGDSGSGAGFAGMSCNPTCTNYALRMGIEWGIATSGSNLWIIMSPWSNVQSALGIVGY